MAARTFCRMGSLTRNLLPLNKACRLTMLRGCASGQNIPDKLLSYEKRGDIALVTFNDSSQKMNTLTQQAMNEMAEIMSRIRNDQMVKGAVLISGKPDCFIAGADIGMLQQAQSPQALEAISRQGQSVLKEIEQCGKPIVAAIKGVCMGGGLEVALACHYRLAMKDKKTVMSVPEVKLGLLPGAGGTQRLPNIISPLNALDMMLTGKNIKPDKAKKWGLVDGVVDPVGPGIKSAQDRSRDYLEEIAIQAAKDLASGAIKKPYKGIKPTTYRDYRVNKLPFMAKLQDKIIYQILARKPEIILDKAREKVMKLTKGNYPAPLEIIKVIETGLKTSTASQGYAKEAESFGKLGFTSESSALMGLYHGQTYCKKNHYGKPQKKVENLGVLGAGLMGAGIVQVSIDKGIHTVLKDMAESGLTRGQQQIEKGLKTAVKKRKLTQFEADTMMKNLLGTLQYDGFDKLDMVIEAVFEDINIKHKVVKEVEAKIPAHCIFASNTSALPIGDIAKASIRPEKIIGMHYFSPVDKMELLEIITTEKTSADTLASAVDVGLRQGKTIIVVKDGPGFYTTRALAAYMSEVFKVLQEGLSPTDLDKFTKKIGFPVGSATLVDEVGVDVAYHVGEFTGRTFGSRFGFTESDTSLLQQMIDKKFMGRKSGLGIFDYRQGGKNRTENAEAIKLIEKMKTKPLMEMNDENLKMRLLSRFTNEAVLILQEGILRNPTEGDIGAVFGLGFPPNLGGPFRFVDIVGANVLVDHMRRFEEVYGERFTPCQLLLDHAKDTSKRFHAK